MISKILIPAFVFSGCCAVVVESLDEDLFLRLQSLGVQEALLQTELLIGLTAALFAGLSMYVTIRQGLKPVVDLHTVRSGFKKSDERLVELKGHMQELQRFIGFSFLKEETLESAEDDHVYWTRICHSLVETDYIFFYNSYPKSEHCAEATRRAESLNMWSRTDKYDPYLINAFIRTGPFMLLRMEAEKELLQAKEKFEEIKRRYNLEKAEQHYALAVFPFSIALSIGAAIFTYRFASDNFNYSAVDSFLVPRTIAGYEVNPQSWGIDAGSVATFSNFLMATVTVLLTIALLFYILRYLYNEVLYPELEKSLSAYKRELQQRFRSVV